MTRWETDHGDLGDLNLCNLGQSQYVITCIHMYQPGISYRIQLSVIYKLQVTTPQPQILRHISISCISSSFRLRDILPFTVQRRVSAFQPVVAIELGFVVRIPRRHLRPPACLGQTQILVAWARLQVAPDQPLFQGELVTGV